MKRTISVIGLGNCRDFRRFASSGRLLFHTPLGLFTARLEENAAVTNSNRRRVPAGHLLAQVHSGAGGFCCNQCIIGNGGFIRGPIAPAITR